MQNKYFLLLESKKFYYIVSKYLVYLIKNKNANRMHRNGKFERWKLFKKKNRRGRVK